MEVERNLFGRRGEETFNMSKRQTAPVEKFNAKRGYGFLRHPEGDIYLHATDVQDGKCPRLGDLVAFRLVKTDEGPRAKDATIL